jgi:hypothetical protein
MNSTELNKKVSLGQFFTKKSFWLKQHILEFIQQQNAEIAFDPFAGGGDLLKAAKDIGFRKTIGYDIDKTLAWEINDSLVSIPKIDNSIIITNPPYLTNYSAKRKGVYAEVVKYFNKCSYDDLYQLAIDKCMENNKCGVMIIPETFINSSFPKTRLTSITVIEDDIFNDTENPVCVICFDSNIKSSKEIKFYKNDIYIGELSYFEKMRKQPRKNVEIKFNSLAGQIALRAVDTTSQDRPIQFMKPENINYDLSKIKHSSRLITLIEMNIEESLIDSVIKESNNILIKFREETNDILLSPFKGNKKSGERRRRLDYLTARAILEEAFEIASPTLKLF